MSSIFASPSPTKNNIDFILALWVRFSNLPKTSNNFFREGLWFLDLRSHSACIQNMTLGTFPCHLLWATRMSLARPQAIAEVKPAKVSVPSAQPAKVSVPSAQRNS